MYTDTEYELETFFPSNITITSMTQTDNKIIMRMNTHSTSCSCPKCDMISVRQHGSYDRKVQDLPVFGKATWLMVNAYEYQCDNPGCEVTTFVENADGFLNYYSRMTDRCEDFICTLALETTCEGCSRICKAMNIKISGDTVIRLLTKRYTQQKNRLDLAATLEGWDETDGDFLKGWLLKNKQVKTITKERAVAYAAAIQETLPRLMQISDRFRFHESLVEVIKNTVNPQGGVSYAVKEA